MKSTYGICLPLLLAHEGGYSNHPSDPGGPTNFGITIFDYRKYVKPGAAAADVRAMTVEEAKRIYRALLGRAALRRTAGRLGLCGFRLRRQFRHRAEREGSSPPARAAGPLGHHQRRCYRRDTAVDPTTLVTKICDERLRFLRSLRTWPIFGAGWGRRVAEVKVAALAMAAKEHHDM